ncbi:sigma factor-like helix-turn-helix DNA-binding protein [Crossiella sp. NPDC003009]
MSPPRSGKRWSQAEEDELLWETRGTFTVAEIAERHGRSENSICIRVASLVRDVREFEWHEVHGHRPAFDWAREELRKGVEGSLSAQQARADSATGTPFIEAPLVKAPPRQKSSPLRRERAITVEDEIVQVWTSITGKAAGFVPGTAELDVLAHVERETLIETGRRLHQMYGKLVVSDWVVECDWANVEQLRITATQIGDQADEARWTGAELLRAGLVKVPRGDRDILLQRLGLEGEGTTLKAIGQRFGVTRERIRQRQTRALNRLRVGDPGTVFRAWDHVRGVLLAALGNADGAPAPDLVLSFLDLAVPTAPRTEAVRIVAALCGCSSEAGMELATRVVQLDRLRSNEREAELREEKRLGRLNARLRFVVDNADWPPGVAAPVLDGDLRPLRLPREADGLSESGWWYAESLGREVGFDSGVELRFAQRLDISDLVRTYCEQALAIPYRLEGRQRSYYPDFVVDLTDGRRLVVEIKASPTDFAMYENIVKFEAATRYCHARGWGFVATNGYRTPACLLREEVSPEREKALVDVLESGVADWPTIRAQMLRHKIAHVELAAMIVRNEWFWRSGPYRLSIRPLRPFT